jgi:hypothetical protein
MDKEPSLDKEPLPSPDKEQLPSPKNLSRIGCLLIENNRSYLHEKFPEVDIDDLEGIFHQLLRSYDESYPFISKAEIVRCFCKKSYSEICKKPLAKQKLPKITYECKPCDDNCSICFEPLNDNCIKTFCSHTFHRSCWDAINRDKAPIKVLGLFDTWLQWVPCPLCRTETSIHSKEIIEGKISLTELCQCCKRHNLRRSPFDFTSHFNNRTICGDDRAIVLRTLLKHYEMLNLNRTCRCMCRRKLRMYSEML